MKRILLGLILALNFGVLAQSKIGFVNTQELFDTMPSRQIAEQQYVAFENEQYSELNKMGQEYQTMLNDYDKNHLNWTPVIAASKQQKIQEKQTQIQRFQQTMQQTLNAYSAELNKPILSRVQEAINIVAERMKLETVVDQSTTLYFNEKLDITDAVIVELLKLEEAAKKAATQRELTKENNEE